MFLYFPCNISVQYYMIGAVKLRSVLPTRELPSIQNTAMDTCNVTNTATSSMCYPGDVKTADAYLNVCDLYVYVNVIRCQQCHS